MEHAYVHEKLVFSEKPELAKLAIKQQEARDAKTIGQIDSINVEWHNKKTAIMKDLVQIKYESCQSFRDAIISSGKAHIVEDVADEFWGRGKEGNGQNIMGKILETLRNDNMLHSEGTPEVKQSHAVSSDNPGDTSYVTRSHSPFPPEDTPHVLILGNSLIKDIIPDKIKNLHVTKSVAYNISEAREVCHNMKLPERTVLQLVTNDVKYASSSVSKCVEEIESLVTELECAGTKVHVILPPPVTRDDEWADRISEVNDRLSEKFDTIDMYSRFISANGKPKYRLYNRDGVHLSQDGVRLMAATIKNHILWNV